MLVAAAQAMPLAAAVQMLLAMLAAVVLVQHHLCLVLLRPTAVVVAAQLGLVAARKGLVDQAAVEMHIPLEL